MVDEGRVARLLRSVEERIDRLEQARAVVTGGDDWRLDAVKYLFVTAIEGCVDVAHHIAASERWGAPDSNAGAFAVLADHHVIELETAQRMGRAVGFRYVLVHQYAAVDDGRVVAALDELGDLRSFVTQVNRWLLR